MWIVAAAASKNAINLISFVLDSLDHVAILLVTAQNHRVGRQHVPRRVYSGLLRADKEKLNPAPF